MIFNPLFLTENGNSQLLTAKQNKLSGNKYLFSDIVKVVMNPTKDQNSKIPQDLEEVVENQIKLVIEGSKKPVQMELKLLSDADTEQAKLNLAEILPADIAQLLVNEDLILDEEKAISYISKEPLKGELQQFVNSMIGSDVVAQNLSDKSGLLLSLEDKKSAVNLELIQDTKASSKNKKITVQTLVVPQKSKLLSLVKQGEQNSLFRMKGDSLPLNKESNDLLASASVLDKENIKPTLSVYTFKYGDNEFSSLTKSIKTNSGFKHNLNLLKNNELNGVTTKAEKVPLEKISFIPSDVKTQNVSGNQGVEKTEALKIVPNNTSLQAKDYSVSKITIVKKQPEEFQVKGAVQPNKNSSDNIPSELKRIDFGKQTNSINSKLNLLNVDGKENLTQPKVELDKVISNKIPDLKVVGKNIQQKKVEMLNNEPIKKNLPDNSLANKQVDVENKESKGVKATQNASDQIQNRNQLNTSTKDATTLKVGVDKTNIKPSVNTQNDKIAQPHLEQSKTSAVDGKISNEVTKNTSEKLNAQNKNEPLKPEIPKTAQQETHKLNSTQNTKSEKTIPGVSNQKVTAELNQGKVDLDNSILENKIEGNQKKIENVNTVQQNTKIEENNSVKTSEKEVLPKSNSIDNPQKIDHEKNSVVKNIHTKETESNKQNEVKAKDQVEKGKDQNDQAKHINEPVVAVEKNVSDKPKNNKKISVKVKNGVKSVSKNGDASTRSFEVGQPKENLFNKNFESQDPNLKNTLPGSNSMNPMVENTTNENYFQQVLNKEEISSQGLTSKVSETANDHNRNVVRSVEVIREISKFISKQEKGSLSFDINPESLGKMKISLDRADHVISARIEVDNEQSKQLIEKNLDKLYEELKENGVELNSLNISLGNSKQQKENDEEIDNNKNNKSNEQGDQVGEVQEEKQKKSMGYNTYEYLA